MTTSKDAANDGTTQGTGGDRLSRGVFRLPHGDPRHGRTPCRADAEGGNRPIPLTDLKTFTRRCDIGIIEGGCCNEENVHVLQDFRRNCDILIALGQCAIMGGLPAMRNAIMHSDDPLRDCLEEAYITAPYIRNTTHHVPNDPALPLLLDRVYPCSDVVHIDHQIPGCAPSAC